MGIIFKCDVCSPSKFQTPNYEFWLKHLLSYDHQSQAKSKVNLNPVVKWENEKDSYVLTGVSNGLHGLVSTLDLLKWISNCGIITECIFHQQFMLFTLASLMPGVVTPSILTQKVPIKWKIKIRPKSELKQTEWSSLLKLSTPLPGSVPVPGTSNGMVMMMPNANAAPKKTPAPLSGGQVGSASLVVTSSSKKKAKGSTNTNNPFPLASIVDQSASAFPYGSDAPPKSTLVFVNQRLSSSCEANEQSANRPGAAVPMPSVLNCLADGANANTQQVKNPYLTNLNSTLAPGSESSSPCLSQSNSTSVSNVAVCGSVGVAVNPETSPLEGGKKKKKKKKKAKDNEGTDPSNPAPLTTSQTPIVIATRPPISIPGNSKPIAATSGGPPKIPASQTPLKGHLDEILSNSRFIIPDSNSSVPIEQPAQAPLNPAPLNFRGGFNIMPGRNRMDPQKNSGSSDTTPVSYTPITSASITVPMFNVQINSTTPPGPAPRGKAKKSKQKQQQETIPASHLSSSQTHGPPQPHQQRASQSLMNPQFPNAVDNLNFPPLSKSTHALTAAPSQRQVVYTQSQHRHPPPPVQVPYQNWPLPTHPHPAFGHAPGMTLPSRPGPGYPVGVGPGHIPLVVSSIFTSQLPQRVLNDLVNPLRGRMHNPYKFTVNITPPFPRYFGLFQKLPDENFKPQKNTSYAEFCRLPLTNQLDEFFLALSLPHSEVLVRWQVILDILVALRQVFPRCELYAFGSIITGLGDFASDIDIYVDLTGESTSPIPLRAQDKINSSEAVDRVKKILKKSLCPHNGNLMVKNLIPVKSARVPILKLTHRYTEINCDLSFENRLSVQNTKMLLFYLNLDERILRFMVLIRYWAKFHNVTGSNHIKNYALTLLVLVYLCKRKLAPPLILLQNLKRIEREQQGVTRNPDEIDGWDSSFCENIDMVMNAGFSPSPFPGTGTTGNGTVSQTNILIQMAIEFFEMCANLDFSKVVVCPIVGDILPKDLFEPGHEAQLPSGFERYANWAVKQDVKRRLNINSCFCVQDPFVLSFNVGCVTPLGTMLKFQLACANTAQVLAKNDLQSFLDVLIRLPEHIGGKKFMKVLKTEQMAEEFKLEIKTKLGLRLSPEDKKDIKRDKKQPKPSFTVPEHLKKYEKLIDEKSMKAALDQARWETFLDLNLSAEFESLFLAEMVRIGILGSKKLDQTAVVCGLWQEFALDYLLDIFGQGLQLQLVSSQSVWVDTPRQAVGKKQKWKIKQFTKKEEENIRPSEKCPEEMHLLVMKVLAFPPPAVHVNYRVWNLEVTYPFWEKRPTYSAKAGMEMKGSDIIRVPIVPSSKEIRREEKENKKRRQKPRESKKDGGKKMGQEGKDDDEIVFKTCFNPIELEKRASMMFLETFEQKKGQETSSGEFAPFRINILLKLEVTSATEKPRIIFIFEQDPTMKPAAQEYQRAISTLSNILLDTFPSYQLFRLAQWLEIGQPVLVSHSESSKIPSETNYENGNAEGMAGPSKCLSPVDGKKKVRTKLEEDLLIPSSSSSESSSEGEEDDLESISGEEENFSEDSEDDKDNSERNSKTKAKVDNKSRSSGPKTEVVAESVQSMKLEDVGETKEPEKEKVGSKSEKVLPKQPQPTPSTSSVKQTESVQMQSPASAPQEIPKVTAKATPKAQTLIKKEAVAQSKPDPAKVITKTTPAKPEPQAPPKKEPVVEPKPNPVPVKVPKQPETLAKSLPQQKEVSKEAAVPPKPSENPSTPSKKEEDKAVTVTPIPKVVEKPQENIPIPKPEEPVHDDMFNPDWC